MPELLHHPHHPRSLPLFALLAANVVSHLGNTVAAVAFPLFVYETTGSAAKVGLVSTAAVLPLVLASFFGGALVDRFGHRRSCVAADVASGVAVALVPLLHYTAGLPFWQLLVLAFLGAVLDSPGEAARQSLVPDLASAAQMPLERVNAAYQAVRQTAGLLGPPLGGLLVVLLGASNVLVINAASFAASAGFVLAAVPSLGGHRKPAEPAQPAQPAQRGARYLTDLREGVAFLRGERTIRTLTLLNSAGNLVAAPLFAVVLPVFAAREFGGAVSLGLLLAASGVGALAGSVLYGALAGRVSRRAVYLGSWIAGAIAFTALVAAPALGFAVVAMGVIGLASNPINPLMHTLTHERTPARLRARVIGARIALANLAVPLGMTGAGALLESTGLRTTLFLMAATQGALAAVVFLLPALRAIDVPAATRGPERARSGGNRQWVPRLIPDWRWIGLGAAAMAVGSPAVPWLLGHDAVASDWPGWAKATGLAVGAALFALGWIGVAAGLRPGGNRRRGARWGAALYGAVGLLAAAIMAVPTLLSRQPPIGYPPVDLPAGAMLVATLLTWPVVLAVALGAGPRRH